MNIFIAGHNGMVGSAIFKALSSNESVNIITATRSKLNLLDQTSVMKFFNKNKIDQVYLAAAKVGGIYANNEYPANFIYENLMIQANVINASHLSDVQKLLFLGSSCIYPKNSKQPIKESSLLTGALESSNEPYSVSKIAGIKMCESYNRQYGRDYRSVMPSNLYGPNDNFHSKNSHVIPAMMKRFHNAVCKSKEDVIIWGSGSPRREFLHVDDMALASIFVMNIDKKAFMSATDSALSHINIGTGSDVSIKNLSRLISKITKYRGNLVFDKSKPDGVQSKLMDSSLINKLGWKAKIPLEDGLNSTYTWFLKNYKSLRL